jgi:RHS repeat-associated protein
VNQTSAVLYADATFARANVGLISGTNTFTAIASDSLGRKDTNSAICNLPSPNSYVYDANGNLLNDGFRYFTYDDENQLISVVVTNNGGISTRSDFVYDGKMRRRVRVEYLWGGAYWVTNQVVHYVYDGNLVIQDRDGNNLPAVAYTRGTDLSGTIQAAGGIGGLLARTDHRLSAVGSPDSHTHYHADANGNITALVNANQHLVAQYRYDPFGATLCEAGNLSDDNLYRYSGNELHKPSGSVCFLYRFYRPELQSWLNHDPAGESGGFNLYAFALNDPVNWFDTDGRSTQTVPNSEGHGNCLSYALGCNDDKDGGIRPIGKKYTTPDDFLKDTFQTAGCKPKPDGGQCAPNENEVALISGWTKDSTPQPFYHAELRKHGSQKWSQRAGDNKAIQIDVPPIEKQQFDLQKAKISHWCCPCKNSKHTH